MKISHETGSDGGVFPSSGGAPGDSTAMREMTASASESGPSEPTTWYLPVVSVCGVPYREAMLSAAKLLETYWFIWDPRCTLGFVTSWAEGDFMVGFEATSASGEDAGDMLRGLRKIASGVQPWLGLGEPTSERPWPPRGPLSTGFGARRITGPQIISSASLVWRANSGHEGDWQFVVELLAAAVDGRWPAD